jgi:site-specific DNA-methyltransferase (adenine-specific)
VEALAMLDINGSDADFKNRSQRKYKADLAYFKFCPKDYPTPERACELYEDHSHSGIDLDTIRFDECITGMEKMPGECVDLVIADPPFGIDFSGKGSAYNRDSDLVVDEYQEIDTDYRKFTKDWMAALQKIMKSHSSAYVFSGWNHLEDVLYGARSAKLTTINHAIWKYQFGVFTKKKFVTSHYHVLLLVKNPNKYYFNKMEHYPLDVWDIKRKYNKGEKKNATTLPTDVIKKCIEFSSKPGDLVFDPFMGMATTAVVAKGTWRHYYGFELNRNLAPVIKERIDNVSLGQDYITLEERLEKIREEGRRKYKSAYNAFLLESGVESVARS